jgi:hypothetical protein
MKLGKKKLAAAGLIVVGFASAMRALTARLRDAPVLPLEPIEALGA